MAQPDAHPTASTSAAASGSAQSPPVEIVHTDPVLVVDFGAQYAQLIARRVRECHVYSEIVPFTATVEELLARKPKAIILSGGPKSVYSPGAPAVDARSVLRRRPGARHLLRTPGDGQCARRPGRTDRHR